MARCILVSCFFLKIHIPDFQTVIRWYQI